MRVVFVGGIGGSRGERYVKKASGNNEQKVFKGRLPKTSAGLDSDAEGKARRDI